MCKGIVLIVNKVTKVLSYKNSGTLTFPTCDRFPFNFFFFTLFTRLFINQNTKTFYCLTGIILR